jgi:TolB-like protein/Flp pilus assembly protein TadD
MIGIVALAIALATAGAFYLNRSRDRIDSIAVLPFVNTSGDANLDYLSDGISDGLMDSLSQLPDVRVASRTSAFRYKGKDVQPRTVAHDLGVRAVVSGRVTQQADAITIGTELIDTNEDRQIWGKQYKGKLTDTVALQQELANNLSERLRPSAKQQNLAATKQHTENNEAYQSFLKGRYYFWISSDESLGKAIEYFNDAIGFDPAYAPAYSGIAYAYLDLALFDFRPPTEAFPKAKAAALKALEIDPNLAEAHSALGGVSWAYDWDWLTAEKEFEKALELNPASVVSHLQYSFYLATVGRFDDAIREGRRAQELDPLSPYALTSLAYIYTFAHRYDEALVAFGKSVELEPASGVGVLTHAEMAWTYAFKGAYTSAISEYGKISKLPNAMEGQVVSGGRGFVDAVAGKRHEALQIIAQFRTVAESRYADAYMVAAIYSGLGDKNRAFDWLNKGVEERSASMIFLKVDPFFDSLHSDPRFQDLLRRMGLPQ